MAQTPQDVRYRFGVFEANAATGELRKQGLRVKVNVQPFQVLLMLLARPGELLTREEISRELWPDGTFVDYEHGVNSAVNRIREALGDQARNPRFIETLARRGYTTEWLATPAELPKTPYRTVQTLFVLLQLMYVGFYVGALANLPEIEELMSPLAMATQIFTLMIATAAVLIPVRAFLLSAVLFHAPGVRGKILRVWPFLLPFDILWALSPFLLTHHIDFGVALACSTLLAYSPFAQRSLVLMGAGQFKA